MSSDSSRRAYERRRTDHPHERTFSHAPIQSQKTSKWGIKVWARSGTSGIIYDFEVYTGKSENPISPNDGIGFGGHVVLRLCENLTKMVNYRLFFDNYFTSIPLLIALKTQGIQATGTIRRNRMKGAEKKMDGEKDLKKKGRGSMDWRYDSLSGLTVVTWYDNGYVQLASNCVGSEQGPTVRRFSAKEKQHVDIPCPSVVHQYNKHMGGVDLSDMLMSLYRVRLRTMKWYHHIFFYLVNLSVIKSWLLYRRDLDNLHAGASRMSLLDFQASIADYLLKHAGNIRTRGRPR